jgi:CRP-like cAMP-binding protein
MFSDRSRGRCLTSNHLLAALPNDVLHRWTPRLEWIDMPQGQVLQDSGQIMRYVYFPTTAIVSLMHVTAEGGSAEIAVAGNDGLVGISLFMGGETALSRAVVETSGGGFRLRREIIMDEFDRQGTAMRLLLRYTQAQITQMAQSAACNRHHTLDQQLSRWLLHRLDRLEGNDLQMTQELIGALLGVRRETVTAGIARLQHTGLIRHSRGAIKVLDRPGLERRACECYAVVRKESDRLLPPGAAMARFNAVCESAAVEQAA